MSEEPKVTRRDRVAQRINGALDWAMVMAESETFGRRFIGTFTFISILAVIGAPVLALTVAALAAVVALTMWLASVSILAATIFVLVAIITIASLLIVVFDL